MSFVGPRPQVQWAVSLYSEEEKGILSVRPGITDYASIKFSNEGEILRITIPPLTEERRKEMVKKARGETENTKISIRNVRRSSNDFAKEIEKDGLPEDEAKKLQDDIQKLTDKFIEKVDQLLEAKEKDIMTV